MDGPAREVGSRAVKCKTATKKILLLLSCWQLWIKKKPNEINPNKSLKKMIFCVNSLVLSPYHSNWQQVVHSRIERCTYQNALHSDMFSAVSIWLNASSYRYIQVGASSMYASFNSSMWFESENQSVWNSH